MFQFWFLCCGSAAVKRATGNTWQEFQGQFQKYSVNTNCCSLCSSLEAAATAIAISGSSRTSSLLADCSLLGPLSKGIHSGQPVNTTEQQTGSGHTCRQFDHRWYSDLQQVWRGLTLEMRKTQQAETGARWSGKGMRGSRHQQQVKTNSFTSYSVNWGCINKPEAIVERQTKWV